MKKILKYQTLSIYIALMIIVIIFSCMSETFLTLNNFLTILRQITPMGIMAVGAMLVMLTGGVDLSVGSGVSLIGIVMAICMAKKGMGIPAAVLVAIILGLMIGVLNAVLVVQVKIPPMIATLGTSWIYKGLSYTLCEGLPISGFPKSFSSFGQGSIGIIPIPIIVFIIVVLLGAFVLNHTAFGRYIYSVGSNSEATRLAGINIKKVSFSAYIICAMLTALAAIITLSRVNSGQPSTGIGQEMNVLTAVVLGGTRFTGGDGKISGVVAGVLVIGVLSNGLVMIGAGDYMQTIIKGAILIFALSINTLREKMVADNKIAQKA